MCKYSLSLQSECFLLMFFHYRNSSIMFTLLHWKFYFYFICLSVCLQVHMCTICVPGAHQGQKRRWIPWTWSNVFWAALWVLGTKPESTVSTFNHWDISPTPHFSIFYSTISLMKISSVFQLSLYYLQDKSMWIKLNFDCLLGSHSLPSMAMDSLSLFLSVNLGSHQSFLIPIIYNLYFL